MPKQQTQLWARACIEALTLKRPSFPEPSWGINPYAVFRGGGGGGVRSWTVAVREDMAGVNRERRTRGGARGGQEGQKKDKRWGEMRIRGGAKGGQVEGRKALWTAYIAVVLTSIQEIVNALVLPQGREVEVIHQCIQAILEGGKKCKINCWNNQYGHLMIADNIPKEVCFIVLWVWIHQYTRLLVNVRPSNWLP